MSRYIKLARKFFESTEWTQERIFSEQEVWLDMIFLACYADHDIDLGKDGILTLHRGEFYYSQRYLAKRWGWPVSRVNRHLARLAEGENPRIERILRETHFETPSETQVETQITVVRLCNYNSYNEGVSKSETPSETPTETPSETNKNKGILRIKGDNNTHTQYSYLKSQFLHASKCAHESAEACAEATEACRAMLQHCATDPEALAEHRQICRSDTLFFAMVELYRCYPNLQQSFPNPLSPSGMRSLLSRYDIEDIWRILEAISNKRDQIRGRSLYLTFRQWATTDIVLANRNKETKCN